MLPLTLLAGLLLLVAGGEVLVRGAVAIARRAGVSPLLVGLTLVGFGTSTPELVTSLRAALAGSPGIAVGNVVGSNVANILLILGVAALVRPLVTEPRALRRDGAALALSTLTCVLLALHGRLDRPAGAMLVLLLGAYIGWTYLRERRESSPSAVMHRAEGETIQATPPGLALPLLATLGGLVLVMGGAALFVDAAVDLARAIGMSERVVGLTVVAVGTSLPEAVTSVVAAARGQSDVAVGNVLGSNVYNVFGILGATALVEPIPIPASFLRLDAPVLVGATALLLLFAWTGRRVGRREGAVFLLAHATYTAWLVFAPAA